MKKVSFISPIGQEKKNFIKSQVSNRKKPQNPFFHQVPDPKKTKMGLHMHEYHIFIR